MGGEGGDGENLARGHRKVGGGVMKGVGGGRLGKRAQEGGGGQGGRWGGEGGDGGEDLARGHRKVGEDREGDGGGGW